MFTWLDYYVRGASETARAAGLVSFDNDVRAMATLSALNLGQLIVYSQRRRIDSDDAVAATLMSCIHAITATACDPNAVNQIRKVYEDEKFAKRIYAVKAVRPSEDLIASLRDARAPETSDWQVPLQSATWYFDIPHRAILVGDETQIRAVFTQPTQWGTVAVVCILTAPGGNKIAGRFAWIWDQNQPVYGLRIEGVDAEQVREKLEHFLRLLVLYEQTAARAEYVPIPRIEAREAAGLKPKKLKARLKKASMFTIRDLRPPRDRFGRRVESSGHDGWRLEQAVKVRGHFKWQPYGPKMSKRKLIWIDPYVRGPKDQPSKPVLEVIDSSLKDGGA